MQKITFNDAPDIVVGAEIDDVRYKLRLMWNPTEAGGFWTLHLWDADRNPILCNLKLVPNFPLLINHHRPGIPKGEFVVISSAETLNRSSFKNEEASLLYIPEDEWNGTI